MEFAAGGPKNYAYRCKSGATKCVVQGFSLNYKNSQKLNFKVLKRVTKDRTGEVVTLPVNQKIVRDKHSGHLTNREEHKRYQVVFTKRVLTPGHCSVPYGYR